MSDTIVCVENLGKRYRIGALQNQDGKPGGLRKSIFNSFQYLSDILREPTEEETLWALRDVSFEVKQGEVLGIIGPNGAGKSTLLKLLSHITEPTTGRIELYGRVGSMLEVGTGFHPELTGRENIYVNGALLGMTHDEINKKFDAIVDFSGVEKFLDTMVKYYSSGMYVRLAFAVAAHLEPEILIIDEVLAVGDADFQRKCLGKMDDLTKGGRTILFVSHNMIAIRSLCQNTILLENGIIKMAGKSNDIVDAYLISEYANVLEKKWDNPKTAPGNEIVRIKHIWIEGQKEYKLYRTHPIKVGVEYWNLTGAHLHITLHFLVEDSIVAFSTWSGESPDWQEYSTKQGLLQTVCNIPARFLNSGVYSINLQVTQDKSFAAYKFKNALLFNVIDDVFYEEGWFGKEPGVIAPVLEWEARLVEKL